MQGTEFYSTAAQVIPLIFLAIAFELKFLTFGKPTEGANAYFAYLRKFAPLLLIFIPAEAAALAALQRSCPCEVNEDIVEGGLVWAVGYFLLVATAGWLVQAHAYANEMRDPDRFTRAIGRIERVIPVLLGGLVILTIWFVLN